jgi:hypothetical protein
MNLLDRYIHEVGRFLPRVKRTDIQAELRSSLIDTLEDRFGQEPAEDQVAETLKEFGNPRDVAGSYHPRGQYLVGPGLFPIFRMVAWIVIAAVLGAQLLAWGIAIFVAGEAFSAFEMLASLVNSIPASLGWVLITFMVLQYFDAKPYLEDEPWDPKSLPEINPGQDTKRGELIFGLIFSTLILMVLTLFPQWVGFITTPGGKFYPNPVILDYLVLIQVSLLANILLDVFLLWKGRWDMLTRIIKLGLEGFSIVILALLVNGHNAWLTARSAGGLFDALESISGIADGSWELVGMNAYRLAFVVAMIVTVIEVIKTVYRLLRAKLSPGVVPAVVIEKKD